MVNLELNYFKKIILFKYLELFKFKHILFILIKLVRKYQSIFIFLLSYYLFYLSLEKCLEGWDECCIRTNWIKLKLIEALSSVLILFILIELIFLGFLSKINFIHIILMYLLFYKYSNGKDFENHGYYNLIGTFLILILLLIGFIPFNIFIFIKRKKYYISFFKLVIFIILFILYYSFNMEFLICDDWVKGLNNTSIENDIYKFGCQMNTPKICPYKIGKYFLDITKLKRIKCEKRNLDALNKILKSSNSPFINNESKRIGYPLVNKEPVFLIDHKENSRILYKYFLNNLIDMNNKELLKNKTKIPEVEIDFSNNNQGIMNINLKFNKSLSKERKSKEKFSKPYSNNIMILYIDSVSRANSIRQLKKTLKFFESFMPYKGNYHKKYPSYNFHSFQFFKYHSFLYHTTYNYPILYYGNKRNKNNILITKYLKKNGFITCYCNDYCMKDNVRTFHNMSLSETYDHQLIICDPNAEHYNKNSIKCLYGKTNSYYLYEYGNQFWRKYKYNRKFLNIIINDGHEGTLEALKYDDDIIFNFLNNLYNDNYLKDSIIFLLSDHGVGMPSIYYFFQFYKLEEHLPMLYIIINDRKNITYNKQYNYIFQNQETLITGYDIYNTIVNIIYGDKYKYLKNKTHSINSPKSNFGESLFNKINQKLRTTKLYDNIVDFVCS